MALKANRNQGVTPSHSRWALARTARSWFSRKSQTDALVTPQIVGLKEPDSVKIWTTTAKLARKYIEALIAENIIGNYPNGIGEIRANEIRNELSALQQFDDNALLKFAQLLKSLEKNKTKLRGATFRAGGFRALFPEMGAAILLTMISDLHGIGRSEQNKNPTFNSFSGCSAGGILASLMVARAPVSTFLTVCRLPLQEIYQNPSSLMQWMNSGFKLGYFKATGKTYKGEMQKEHLDELGSKLYILLGVQGDTFLGRFIPKRTFFMPHTFSKSTTPIVAGERSIPWIVGASANYFFSDSDMFDVESPFYSGQKVRIIDPGGVDKLNAFPLDLIKHGLEHDEIVFAVGNIKPWTNGKTLSFGNRHTLLLSRCVGVASDWLIDGYNSCFSTSPEQVVEKIGAGSAYVEGNYRADSPDKKRTVQISTMQFAPPEDLEVLVRANEARILDQMYSSLVNPSYLESQGIPGNDAYEIWKSRIDSADGRKASIELILDRDSEITTSLGYHRAITAARNTIAQVTNATRRAAM